jgi:hypothetical protein
MFELYVIVGGIVIFNILKLIMKIVPNYPTVRAFYLPAAAGVSTL